MFFSLFERFVFAASGLFYSTLELVRDVHQALFVAICNLCGGQIDLARAFVGLHDQDRNVDVLAEVDAVEPKNGVGVWTTLESLGHRLGDQVGNGQMPARFLSKLLNVVDSLFHANGQRAVDRRIVGHAPGADGELAKAGDLVFGYELKVRHTWAPLWRWYASMGRQQSRLVAITAKYGGR